MLVNPSIRCPLHDRLRDQLARHYQLRFITMDPTRELVLVNLNNPNEATRLTYEVDWASLELVYDDDIKILDYPEAEARLKVWRLPERCEASSADPYRPCGILVRGRRTVYDNTLFRFEGNPHSGWFAGYLDCGYIDDLANEYDDRVEAGELPDVGNPVTIVSRRRDGLAAEHPFTRALEEASSAALQELVEREENRERESSRTIASEKTQRLLTKVARQAARFLEDQLRELDEEEPSAAYQVGVRPLQLIPPEMSLTLGHDRTMSIFADEEGLDGQRVVNLDVEPGGIVELSDGLSVSLQPHARRTGVLVGQAHLRPLLEGEALLSATIADREEIALLRVRPPEVEMEPEAEAHVPPAGLEFQRSRYRVGWRKRKQLRIAAPAELVLEGGSVVHVTSDHSGVVVRGQSVELHESVVGLWSEGVVDVEGRALGARATLMAALGSESARCRVVVEEREEGPPPLKIELVDEEFGVWRAVFDPPEPLPTSGQVLRIYTRHPSLRSVLGPSGERQDSPEWRAVLAEVVTDAIVRRLLERKYPPGIEPVNVQEFYLEMYGYSSRLLPLIQSATDLGLTS